eukprot:CAMPEP_0118957260 /NCGR_PEP_ID=MMETSP1169-20130426/62006_1 /TAXON_ID=36882 /ORGANISM="Pyramimonas obovata, Strain CCMP722" /LENGTH=534 /DNA_ID=CAMNT_0006905317 /DNA_START=167 /DNA_END=1771 /DNA_ORIENTATION=-
MAATGMHLFPGTVQSGLRSSRVGFRAAGRLWKSASCIRCTRGGYNAQGTLQKQNSASSATIPEKLSTPTKRCSRARGLEFPLYAKHSHICSATNRTGDTIVEGGVIEPEDSRDGHCLNPAELRVLDEAKRQLHRDLLVAALRAPAVAMGRLIPHLKHHLLSYPRVHNVVKPADCNPMLSPPLHQSERLLLLRAEYAQLSPPGLPSEVRSALECGKETSECTPEVQLVQYTVRLGYDHLLAEDVLGHLLPPGMTVPSGHEEVGHIIHLNLRTEHQPYRHLIAHVLLQKHAPRIRTVVNKTSATGGRYRVFGMEVLAGEPNLETQLRENGILFELDFGQMYWNSRLSGEREALVALFSPTEVVCDACAGVGPISIAAAARGCQVFANDLNPEAVEYLKKNASQNKCEDRVETFNTDGGDFVRQCLAGHEEARPLPHHIVMNLPSHAIEVLVPALIGAFPSHRWQNRPLPLVHVYCFSGEEDPEADAVSRVCAALQLASPSEVAALEHHTRRVRNVAPGKHMIRVTFRMPVAVAFSE